MNGVMKILLIAALTLAALQAVEPKAQLTKDQHKAEAARHATRAAEFAAKAAKHEANAQRLAKPGYNAMQYKWPALARGPENLERDRAMQARRAEAESREKQAFHHAMAEKSADAEP